MAPVETAGNTEPRSRTTEKQRQKSGLSTTQADPSNENDSESLRKRRRVSKACDQCRLGKLKCNGEIPQCETCFEGRKSCSYGSAVRRRGLRTGYVRALECLWGLVFQTIEGSENSVGNLLASTSKQQFWFRDDQPDGPKPDQTPLEAWKSSKIPQAIDVLLSTDTTLDDDQASILSNNSACTKEVQATWNLPEDVMVSKPKQTGVGSAILRQHCGGNLEDQNRLRKVSTAQISTHPSADQESHPASMNTVLRLPPNPQKLLDHFFAFTHSWLPFVERHATLKTLFLYRKGFVSMDRELSNSGDHAVLWAIFAYASLALDQSGDTQQSEKRSFQSVDQIYTTARNLVPQEKEDNYSLGHIQALLILSLFHFSTQRWNTAQLLVGNATLLASHIGCDQNDNNRTEYHRRTWLACFVLNILMSLRTEKPPHLRSENVQSCFPIDESGYEEWEPWQLQTALRQDIEFETTDFVIPTHTLSVFNHLLSISCIINDWICSKATDSIQKCKQALEKWNENLPEHIKVFFGENPSTLKSNPPPANILNLLILQSFLITRFSGSQKSRPPVLSYGSQELVMLIQSLEQFITRYAQWAMPPPFHVLLTVLPEVISENESISDIIAELKRMVSAEGSVHQSLQDPVSESGKPQEGDVSQHPNQQLVVGNNSVSEDSSMRNEPFDFTSSDPAAFNLNTQVSHDFQSFTNINESWSNVEAGILLGSSNGGTGGFGSHIAQLSTLGTSDSNFFPQPVVNPEDPILGYFNAWDDLEIGDPDQFKRNLGYLL